MIERLKASPKGLEQVEAAGQKKGWTKTKTPAWWLEAGISQSTLRRFWHGLSISKKSFIAICKAVGIEQWKDVSIQEQEEEYNFLGELSPGKRILAAILFTDAVNFSKKMNENEELTLHLIDRDLAIMSLICQRFEGQVLKSTGDGLLMYFSSAIQAVGCAVEIQKNLDEVARNSPPEKILSHRIGINLGDVFIQNGDVMGNGVNIAARLQTIAKPGGICISQSVYDLVKNNLSVQVNYLGYQTLKNISEAVPVYQIFNASKEARNLVKKNSIVPGIISSGIVSNSLPQNLPEDWGEAPDIYNFYGRSQEFDQVKQWLIDPECKVITIWGMGGIGKTTLAVALADKMTGEFDYFIWRNLKFSPSFQQLLKSLLVFFSQDLSIPENNIIDPHQGTNLLLQYLRQKRCLIVLDEIEGILENHRQNEGYRELFRRLERERHQSCILLTSREKPEEIATLEGERKSVQSLLLQGLDPKDALNLFQDKGFLGTEKGLVQLVNLYGGNPLALKIIATLIQELFQGDVHQFLSQNTLVLGNRLRQLFQEQLRRLSLLEIDMINWLTVLKTPVTLLQLQSYFVLPPTLSLLMETLTTLERKSLIEKKTDCDQVTFTLQAMVMKYVLEELIRQAILEIKQSLQQSDLKSFKVLRKYALIYDPQWLSIRLRDALLTEGGWEIGDQLKQILPRLRGKTLPILGYLSYNLKGILENLEVDVSPYEWENIPLRILRNP